MKIVNAALMTILLSSASGAQSLETMTFAQAAASPSIPAPAVHHAPEGPQLLDWTVAWDFEKRVFHVETPEQLGLRCRRGRPGRVYPTNSMLSFATGPLFGQPDSGIEADFLEQGNHFGRACDQLIAIFARKLPATLTLTRRIVGWTPYEGGDVIVERHVDAEIGGFDFQGSERLGVISASGSKRP